MKRARSKPVSPGIITSRIRRSKCRPSSLARASLGARRGGDAIAFAGEEARQQIADAAVVVDQQQMRGVVGRLRRRARGGCSDGCSLRHDHSLGFLLPVPKIASSTLSGSSRSIIARRNWRTVSAPSGSISRERAVDAVGLQPGELRHQRLALGGGVKQALPAVVIAGLLDDIALVEQLLEHPAERLLGDAQDVQQVGDLQAGIAVDEMHHPVMGPAEPESLELMVGIADEVAVGEEQQFDDVPAQFAGPRGRGRACGALRIGVGGRLEKFMSVILTYLGFNVTKLPATTKL